ncbi:MAG: hypothetical protein JJ858_09205 [Rhizobiaceae bacterium]|nr:hypothetical protein [Rhizobiaceae bacterium]
MKTLIALATVTMISVSGASALSFHQIESDRGVSADLNLLGDGFIQYKELRNKTGQWDRADFDAADVDGNGKLSPSEFRRLG